MTIKDTTNAVTPPIEIDEIVAFCFLFTIISFCFEIIYLICLLRTLLFFEFQDEENSSFFALFFADRNVSEKTPLSVTKELEINLKIKYIKV